MSRAEAAGRAKKIINEYCRKNGAHKLDIYSNGKKGYDGGMRKILDIIMNGLKEESIAMHFKDVIDRYVSPSSWVEQLSIIKEYIFPLRKGILPRMGI